MVMLNDAMAVQLAARDYRHRPSGRDGGWRFVYPYR